MKKHEYDDVDKAAIVRGDPELADRYLEGTLVGALHVLSRQARLMVGAHQSALSYVPDGKFELGIHTHSFSAKWAEYNTYDVMPTGEGIWGIIAEQKTTKRLTHKELLAHPRWKNFSHKKDDRGLEHPELPGWLAAPILDENSSRLLGVVQLSDKFEGDFTQEDGDKLVELAAMIAPTFMMRYEIDKRRVQMEAELQEVDMPAAATGIRRAHDNLQNKLHDDMESRVLGRTAELVQANKALQSRSEELERLNRLFVGREHRMIELKREINEMARASGKPEPYELSFTDDDDQTDRVPVFEPSDLERPAGTMQ